MSIQDREQIEAPLFQQIGQLKVKTIISKKITDQFVGDRRRFIDPAHPQLNIRQQCDLLRLARSTYYYQPVGEWAENLALMERIDKLFTDRPELGRTGVPVRRMHQELTTPDEPINSKRIRHLMRLMGLEAVYPKPNLSNQPKASNLPLPVTWCAD